MYQHYLNVLALNGRLLGRDREEPAGPTTTVPAFLDFLDAQLATCEETELADHLRSYIRTTQNLAQVNTRAGERPVVYPVPKHLLSRSAMAFVIALMIALFAAMVIEHGKPSHRPSSAPSDGQRSGN